MRQTDHDARDDTTDENIADGYLRYCAQQDCHIRGRYQHRHPTHGHDWPHGYAGMVPPPRHFGNQCAAQHRCIRHAGAGQSGKDNTTADGCKAQSSRDLRESTFDRINTFYRQP